MANEAEETWRIFRQYECGDVAITESEEGILFRQLNSIHRHARARAWIVGIVMFLCAFGVPFWMLGVGEPPKTALWTWTILMCLAFISPVVAYETSRCSSYIDVRRGFVEVGDGDECVRIALSELRSLDVQPTALPTSGENVFGIFVWHGPVSRRTLTQPAMRHAIALKEGVEAAIGLLNPKRPEARAMQRQAFEE